ncbi:MAG: UDP-3-O-(3-hydroxymyristoyl)glucosamine N-acyltransferase [Acidobacteria bacterium]|nr:UDP-3-O-(3-hydroxymyristoyl)glucosamine N-acyltransferase [Acidobacteriota bacterium]
MPLTANSVTVAALAGALQARYSGDGAIQVGGAGSLEAAEPGELSYVDGPRNFAKGRKSRCSVLIAPEGYADPDKAVVYVGAPRLAFARALMILYPDEPLARGIHPTAVVSPGARLRGDVAIGAYAVIGPDTMIGDGTQIGEHATISRDVLIGERCLIYPGARLYPGVTIGNECVIHAGAVIGSDGLGFVLTESGYEKYPQRGGVTIGDRVEIGANTTIDRGSIEDTMIGKGTKLDNLIHVAHNCVIGTDCVVAAQTGIAGSTVIGNGVRIGGQVGIADHCTIEDNAILGAQAGVPTGKRIRAGTMVWGTPARPMSEFREQYKDILSIRSLRQAVDLLVSRLETLERAREER